VFQAQRREDKHLEGRSHYSTSLNAPQEVAIGFDVVDYRMQFRIDLLVRKIGDGAKKEVERFGRALG